MHTLIVKKSWFDEESSSSRQQKEYHDVLIICRSVLTNANCHHKKCVTYYHLYYGYNIHSKMLKEIANKEKRYIVFLQNDNARLHIDDFHIRISVQNLSFISQIY